VSETGESGDITIFPKVNTSQIDEAVATLNELIQMLDDADINTAINEAEEQISSTVSGGQIQLKNINKAATATEASLGNLKKESNDFFKGFNWSVRRVSIMIPGIRDAYRQVQSIQRIRMMGLSIGGIVSIALMVYSLYNMVMRYIAEQERKEREYRELIMRTQGFTNRQQFVDFQREQERAISMWRSRAIR
jgi:hypothetical protein